MKTVKINKSSTYTILESTTPIKALCNHLIIQSSVRSANSLHPDISSGREKSTNRPDTPLYNLQYHQ